MFRNSTLVGYSVSYIIKLILFFIPRHELAVYKLALLLNLFNKWSNWSDNSFFIEIWKINKNLWSLDLFLLWSALGILLKLIFWYILLCIVSYRLIGLVGRVFTNDPGDWGSIPGRVIPKTLKMVLNTSLLNTQQYKVHIKGKVEQSREWSSALPYTLV